MTISFIGGGVMAESFISGILRESLIGADQIYVSDPVQDRREYLSATYKVNCVKENLDILEQEGKILLAIKPQTLPEVYEDLKGKIAPGRSVISIVAGSNSADISSGLGHQEIIRVMPNTPAQIGKGMLVWTAMDNVSEVEKNEISSILKTLGDEYYVQDEKYIDMATALSASGPAYVFLFIQSLIDSGVYLGMPRDMARHLVLQTVMGSTELVIESGKHPSVLSDMVTSPGGTTIEALVSLENDGLRAALINGVRAAFDRSVELGN
ncbi:pyrroline-5-carboxylate reductase [Chloroflexi bacterium]|nr:pyrroline-5-carboxylate reductase [Chloroflexota bacterium]